MLKFEETNRKVEKLAELFEEKSTKIDKISE